MNGVPDGQELHEEWATRFPEAGGTIVNGWNAHYPFFWKGPSPKGENVVRLVSNWFPVDGDGDAA